VPDWAITLVVAALASLPGVLAYLGQRRKSDAEAAKLHADVGRVEPEALRRLNLDLVADNQRLRENLAQFDNELKAIREDMAAMRREYDAEIAAMKRSQDEERAAWSRERGRLYRGIRVLVRQLAEHDIAPCWQPDEDETPDAT
jgi:Skp family chaperone for outer membrane proteins